MTAGLSAFGTFLKIGDGGGTEVFTTIAEVKTLSGPSLSLDTVDVTSHDSSGGYEEHVATILRTGNVTFGINFVPTGATHREASGGLLNDLKNKTLRNFKLVFSDSGNTTWTFAAFVTGFDPSADVDGAIEASVTLKVSGNPVLT